MLTRLDPIWLVFAVAAVSMLAYLFSVALQGVLRDAGFGVVANAAVITAGFFAAIHLGNSREMRFDLAGGALTGVAGAFVLLLAVVLLKAALKRL
ncbi:hypothetical protein [Chelativorans sp. AA-79]|uniref:hypothetical protein n=1 Tax=Chelativorans sp. AA-79 TaxID=3028735 RepID=UPI0023FA090B|nr:hypothetical protein [Chelativorans sp. AA-79]WEX10110.1 hypothetical protein PVE73_03855 [Chelativorans sp. AA-79]